MHNLWEEHNCAFPIFAQGYLEVKMKTSYKKLLVLESVLFLILILNSFVSSILNRYNLILSLIIILGFFKLVFGFEKDRHRYTKDIIFEIIIFLLVFFLLYYLSGLIISFARTGNYLNWYGLSNFILPTIVTIILKEFLRYMLLQKSEGSKLLTVTTCLLFIFLDVSNAIYYNGFASKYESFLFVALSLMPAISTNIVCTYISRKVGYKPIMVYLLIMNTYSYFMPIVPNPSEYISSMVQFLVPIALGYKIYSFYEKERDKEVSRDYNKKRILPLLIPTAIIIVLVYFVSGYFHYYAIAVASGSMSPNIHKGDVVIIEKIDKDYESLKEGQVIAYKYDGLIIVHRLEKILKNGDKYYFYTKGDANEKTDNWTVEEDMIIGTVNYKIAYIGLPTVWLNEL